MRVRVLGGLAVEGVDLTRLGSRKARRVLARLALARGAPVSVDALIETVWGGAGCGGWAADPGGGGARGRRSARGGSAGRRGAGRRTVRRGRAAGADERSCAGRSPGVGAAGVRGNGGAAGAGAGGGPVSGDV